MKNKTTTTDLSLAKYNFGIPDGTNFPQRNMKSKIAFYHTLNESVFFSDMEKLLIKFQFQCLSSEKRCTHHPRCKGELIRVGVIKEVRN